MNYDNGLKDLSKLEIELDTAPKYQLPEPEKFMSAKAYKAKMAEPVEEMGGTYYSGSGQGFYFH